MTSYAKSRITNPAHYFETPEDVLKNDKLSHHEKEKVLKSMAADAKQMIEASAEGMVYPEPLYKANDLQSALEQLSEMQEQVQDDARAIGKARFQRIVVVATANQDLNRQIATVAFDLAEIARGRVSIISVVPHANEAVGMVTAAPMASVVPPMATDANRIIEDREALLAELNTEFGAGSEAHTEVLYGLVEQVIAGYANDHNADVIVVGSPNRSWLEALFRPSTASSVRKAAPCPVLVVPELA